MMLNLILLATEEGNVAGERKNQWKQDPEAVKADILRVAVEQFATHGLSGARIAEITRQTATSKRMIYYYFKDKEGLYYAALESEYRRARSGEASLDLSHLGPVQALRFLAEHTFDFHRNNPNFVRLIATENIHNAAYLEHFEVIRDLNSKAVEKVADIYLRGVVEGVFRKGVKPVELHWAISAMSFYNVSNRHTFSAGFGPELHSPEGQENLRSNVANAVIRSIMSPKALAEEESQSLSNDPMRRIANE